MFLRNVIQSLSNQCNSHPRYLNESTPPTLSYLYSPMRIKFASVQFFLLPCPVSVTSSVCSCCILQSSNVWWAVPLVCSFHTRYNGAAAPPLTESPSPATESVGTWNASAAFLHYVLLPVILAPGISPTAALYGRTQHKWSFLPLPSQPPSYGGHIYHVAAPCSIWGTMMTRSCYTQYKLPASSSSP